MRDALLTGSPRHAGEELVLDDKVEDHKVGLSALHEQSRMMYFKSHHTNAVLAALGERPMSLTAALVQSC